MLRPLPFPILPRRSQPRSLVGDIFARFARRQSQARPDASRARQRRSRRRAVGSNSRATCSSASAKICFLNRLSFAILRIEQDCQFGRFTFVSRSAEAAAPSRRSCRRPAAFSRGPRRKPISSARDRRPDPRDFHQLAECRVACDASDLPQAALDEYSILAFQRDDVGHGSERDQIELCLQIEALPAAAS